MVMALLGLHFQGRILAKSGAGSPVVDGELVDGQGFLLGARGFEDVRLHVEVGRR